MIDTQDYIVKKYGLDLSKGSPFEIPCCRKDDLPLLLKELGFKTIVEVGVFEGVYSEILCKTNPDAKVYSVDSWLFYPTRNNFRTQKHQNGHFKVATSVLSQYPNNTIIKKWSQDAVKDFPDESLDFVFIDSDHSFEHITADIAAWGKKVRKGGIVSGHDFDDCRKSLFCSVEAVVRAWTKAKYIHPWFILNSTHPNERSWMWVKQ